MCTKYTEIYKDILKINGECNSNKILDFIVYNTSGGKEFRSKLFRLIANDIEDQKISYVFELLQGAFVAADDVMDESTCRRGVDCYYIKNGMITVRYAQYFVSVLGRIMKNSNKFLHLRSFYYQIIFSTCLGQTLDVNKKTRDEFILSLYNTIAEYKTSLYTIYFPLAAGYIYKNKPEPKNLKEYCKIIGIIFQMFDDLLNFFPEISKKTENDLEELKLTFFTCKLANEDSDIVNDYFNSRKVSEKLVEKVKSFFPYFKDEITKFIDELRELEDGIDKKVLDCLKTVYEERKCLLN